MHRTIPVLDIDVLLAEADATATRLHRRLQLPAADRDDLRQELLVDLIRRLPAFDPDRGALGAFANVVLRNQAYRIADRVLRERRGTGGELRSLDAMDREGTSLGDRLSEDDGLAAWHGQTAARVLADLRLDLTATLARLDGRDRRLCAALVDASVDDLADRGFGSRAGLYRRLRELRSVLTAHGLQAA